jgi:LysM repeat protein
MDRVCPLLALAADRRTAVDGVDGGHRCHALEPPAALERDRQSRLCLTPAHQRCERYLAYLGRGGSPQPGAVAIADGLRSTRMLLTPEPAWRGMAGRARGSSRGLAVAGAVLVVGGTGAAIVAASVVAPDGLAAASATPRPSDSPTATPDPTTPPPSAAAATASPTTLPTATPAPTARPATPAPTAAPTPAPTPVRTYVVQAGDTLALIAQQFGVSVSALQVANGIADPDEIVIGDVLVIP